jgi:hypothetical protein
MTCLRQQAQENLQKHIQERLPGEYQNCMTGMKQVLRLSWEIANRSNNSDNNGNTSNMAMTGADECVYGYYDPHLAASWFTHMCILRSH